MWIYAGGHGNRGMLKRMILNMLKSCFLGGTKQSGLRRSLYYNEIASCLATTATINSYRYKQKIICKRLNSHDELMSSLNVKPVYSPR